MSIATYTTDNLPSDQIGRPVQPLHLNGTYHVVEANDAKGEVTISADQPYQFPRVTLPLTACQPLCAHCYGLLEESEDMAPGECRNPDCFFYIEG